MTGEIAAAVREMRLQSLGNEAELTSKVIAAIPEAQREWKPDAKARTAFEVAWHIVSSEVQMLEEIADMKFTMEERFPQVPGSVAGMVAWYGEHFPKASARVRALTPEQLTTVVDFYGAFKFPLFVYIGFVESHSIHHRGQLSVYLRPMGSKVPSIYGGSADMPWQPQ